MGLKIMISYVKRGTRASALLKMLSWHRFGAKHVIMAKVWCNGCHARSRKSYFSNLPRKGFHDGVENHGFMCNEGPAHPPYGKCYRGIGLVQRMLLWHRFGAMDVILA